MRKVLIFHDFPDEYKTRLTSKFDGLSVVVCKKREEVFENIEDTEILISFKCSGEMLDRAKQIRWIHALSAGVDSMPLDLIKERGIILTNARGVHSIHMAEYAIWAMISLARNTHTILKNQIKGEWNAHVPQGEIFGATLGILGLGSIGREIAKKASALGMHVIGVRNTPGSVDYVEKVYGEDGMAEVFRESDYIINLLPHTSKTRKIINMDFFKLMKGTACFINMGRGGTVDEEDLILALKNNGIRAAVSDVFNDEPLHHDSPLWKMDNVILTPHIAGVSTKYIEKSIGIIEHNIEAYLKGGKMINLVDFEKGY